MVGGIPSPLTPSLSLEERIRRNEVLRLEPLNLVAAAVKRRRCAPKAGFRRFTAAATKRRFGGRENIRLTNLVLTFYVVGLPSKDVCGKASPETEMLALSAAVEHGSLSQRERAGVRGEAVR